MAKKIVNQNKGLITSRVDFGARVFIYLLLLISGSFVAISVYDIIQNAVDAASWGVLVLFGFIFAGILLYEENFLPKLAGTKIASYIAAGFLLFIGVPVLIAFITSMNIAVVVLAALFIVPGMILLIFTFADEKQWSMFKVKTKKTLHLSKRKKRKVRNFKRKR